MDQLYLAYMGRDAVSAEFAYWLGAGRSSDERAAILADAAGHAHTVATVDQLYRTYMGRGASDPEVGYWEGQIRAGADFAAVRSAIAADPAGRAHIADIIGQGYGDYFGRAPTAAETGYWTAQLAAGVSIGQFDTTLARDYSAYGHTLTQIADAYQLGLGRAPGSAEQTYWLNQIRAGTSLHDMRVAIANDPAAVAGTSDGAVRAAYEEYMGRDPTAAELGYWNGQARAGVALSGVRAAVLDDPAGHGHAVGAIANAYQTVFGRAPSAGEQATWLGLFAAGATAGTLEATLVQDGGAAGVLRVSAASANTTVTLPAGFAHVVVSSFNYAGGAADPYAGASVFPHDVDRIDLRGTAFAGTDPLAHASELVELDGSHDVLITLDAHHDILLTHTTLASLHPEQFIF